MRDAAIPRRSATADGAGGRDWYGYKAAARRADAAREMLRGTDVDVAMQARLDYVAAVREAGNVGVIVDLERDVAECLRVTRETHEAGRVPRFYLLRDETEYANVLQMKAMATSRAEQAVIALKTTLGIDLASAVTLPGGFDYTPVTVSVEEAVREAIARHPDVRAAVKQREAAEAEVRAAHGNYFPQVSLSAMYDWALMRSRDPDTMRSRTESPDGYSVGVVVTLPSSTASCGRTP